MAKNRNSEEDFLDNALSYIKTFETIIDPEIDPSNKDKQYFDDLKRAELLEVEIAEQENIYKESKREFDLRKLNLIKDERKEVVNRILRVYKIDKKLKELKNPVLVQSLKKAVKFYFPYVSFNRINIDAIDPKTSVGAWVLEKVNGVNIVEKINEDDTAIERALFKLIQPVFDLITYEKNIKEKRSTITTDEIKIVMDVFNQFVKKANQYDVDFSKYDRGKCKPEDFYDSLLSENDDAVELFSALTNVDVEVAKKYINQNNYKLQFVEKLLSNVKKIEEDLDSIPDGMGYYDSRIEEKSAEYSKVYQHYLQAEQNRKDEMLTIEDLREKYAVKKDEDWSR